MADYFKTHNVVNFEYCADCGLKPVLEEYPLSRYTSYGRKKMEMVRAGVSQRALHKVFISKKQLDPVFDRA